MYKIKTKAEIGYLSGNIHSGGSVKVIYDFIEYEKNGLVNVNQITDKLDHSLVTDDKDVISHSYRYYLLKETTFLLNDIYQIVTFLIKKDNPEMMPLLESITIELDSTSYTFDYFRHKDGTIIHYNDKD